MEHTELDPERQKQAKKYARLSRRLMVLDFTIGLIYIVAWLIPISPLDNTKLVSISEHLKLAILNLTTNDWLLVAGFGVVFGGVYLLISLPIAYYESFILPHRFKQSTENLRGWIGDQLKGLVLSALLGGMLLEIIYAVLRLAPYTWWLWASIILLFFSVLLANLAPVLLMPIFYKFVPLGDENTELVERLLRLAERTHTRVKGVFKFDMSRRTKAANAALTGLGNTRRIILGDTLLNEFTSDEIETVLAHELGHQVHRDIPLGIIVQSLLTVVGLYLASLGLDYGVSALGFNGPSDVAAMPVIILVIGAYSLVTMPLGNMFSRWRERRADQFALEVTGNGQAYASALVRLANQNLADVDPEPWVEFLFYSHPALGKRIAMAQGIRNPNK